MNYRLWEKGERELVVKNFHRQALRELKKIKLAWTGLNYSTAKGCGIGA